MYNFLDPRLSPKVNTTAPATDNYEVTNLTSGNLITRARGFLAYSTVKPPVEITFELICPVNIHYIVLWTTLGTQKCTAIDIATKNCNRGFTSIGYAKFNSSGIIFCNCRIYSTSNLPPNVDQNFHIAFFNRNSFRSFTTVNIVKVCILQTERSVPCLGKIEIWGKPSKMCSLVTVNTINRLMQGPTNSSNGLVAATSLDSKHKTLADDWEIPDEFKDALTFEVMAIPITLPSGNTVDQSTLEKYIANESSYGRTASDPFTGQKFTDTRKPVFNVALKSRIDMFLVQNSHRTETFTVKRTLGKTVNENNDEPKTGAIKRKANETVEEKSKVKICESKQAVLSNISSDPDERLNEAIRNTVNSSGFVCFTNEEKTVTSTLNSCILCKNINSLYAISCSHLYCRNCLLSVSKELKCRKCNKPFTKNDPKKFYS